MKAKSRTSKTFGKLLALTLTLSMVIAASATPLTFAKGVSNGNEYVKAIPIYDTLAEAQAAAAELNEELTGEGSVLLKNNGALPFAKGTTITVFGSAATSLQGGSGRVDTVLRDAGFTVNSTVVTESNYARTDDADIRKYGNAAVVVLKRGGSEGSDLSVRTNEEANDAEENVGGWEHVRLATNNGKEYKHNQMLTSSELGLIEKAKATCDQVVVLLNTSNAMEMYNLEHDAGIDAIMFIGRPGANGVKAIGKLLKGTINPSGKTADIWYRDFTADPTWYNSIANIQNDAGSNSYVTPSGSASANLHGVDYEEDIYLGYGYYESVYAEILEGRLSYDGAKLTKAAPANAQAEAEAWYADNVVYPFGYGLSYSEFEVSNVKLSRDELKAEEISSSLADGPAAIKTMTVYATVTNVGGYAGKHVVEVYSKAPYDPAAGVEKLAVKLVGYAKTDMLAPGASQRLAITINVQDLAYYSDSTAHDAVLGAYVLDAGDYMLYATSDSHCYNSDDGAGFTVDAKAVMGLDD
ncbi:MAG: glycoside hydrolase family 3 C-terminal domain-containing protein, partial [Clostridia bacterium]|nr:glycoside hydrolase family 3 C-terminal domain-containing protein [Clostridia bacterium]